MELPYVLSKGVAHKCTVQGVGQRQNHPNCLPLAQLSEMGSSDPMMAVPPLAHSPFMQVALHEGVAHS